MKLNYVSLFIISLILIGCSEKMTIETSGILEGKDITVSSQVLGIVTDITKKEGDQVKKGETILIIDSTEYVMQKRQAQALLLQAQSQYELVKKGARAEDIAAAKEVLSSAKVNYESSKKDYERYKELLESNSVSVKMFDDVQTKYLISERQHKQAIENYNKLINGSRPEEIELAKGRYDQALAQVELAKKKVLDCTLKATSDGFLTKISVDVGELVNMGAVVAKVTDLSEMTLKIFVKETDLGLIKLNQQVDVSVDSFPDSSMTGRIIFISNSAEFTPKNIQSKDDRVKLVFEVKLLLDNPHQKLKAGMIGDVTI